MRRCRESHVGGPGVRVGRSCVHAGPIGLALVIGAACAVAALSNGHVPWWGVLAAFLFWPLFSIVGQLL